MSKQKKIVIHCSATPNGRYHNAEDIHNWHKQRGWSGIGYHYVIRTDGIIDNGRPEYWEGAHAKGHNDSIGICLIGTDEYSPQQWASLTKLTDELRHKYDGINVIGHNEVSSKSCPGFDVQKWLRGEI